MLSIVGQSRSSMPRRRARAPDLADWIVILEKTRTFRKRKFPIELLDSTHSEVAKAGVGPFRSLRWTDRAQNVSIQTHDHLEAALLRGKGDLIVQAPCQHHAAHARAAQGL